LRTPPAGELAGVLSAAETRGAATSERIDVPRPQVVACIAINDLRGAMLGAACGSIDIRGRRAAEFFALLRQYPNVPAMLVDRSGRELAGPADNAITTRHRESLRMRRGPSAARHRQLTTALGRRGDDGGAWACWRGASAGCALPVRLPNGGRRRLRPVPITGEDEIGLSAVH
jgi:hypothetical protein